MEQIPLRQQNFMFAVRREMGWPAFKPANDAIAFCSGLPVDFEIASELGRIVGYERKDLVYTGWICNSVTEPTFAVAFREFLTVDVIDRLVPYAEDDDTPLILVNPREDEFFAVDRRGSLVRLAGKPRNIAVGKKLAMKRIKASAARMGDRLLQDNRQVPFGGEWTAPTPPQDIIVNLT